MARRRFKSAATAARLIDRSVGKRTPGRIWALWRRALADADVAMMVYALRNFGGLTQAELAERVGTTASAISRLEIGGLPGHSLAMLRRIAGAVGKKVVIRFATVEAVRGRAGSWTRRRRPSGRHG